MYFDIMYAVMQNLCSTSYIESSEMERLQVFDLIALILMYLHLSLLCALMLSIGLIPAMFVHICNTFTLVDNGVTIIEKLSALLMSAIMQVVSPVDTVTMLVTTEHES